MALQLSDSGLKLLQRFEGYRNKSYLDSAGIWTIGYGTTRINGKRVTPGMTCTLEQALAWKQADLGLFIPAIERLVKVPLTQNMVDSLVSFVYNVGEGALAQSSLLRAINGRRLITPDLFTRWNKITVVDKNTGREYLKVLPGLTARRKAEYELFMKEDERPLCYM